MHLLRTFFLQNRAMAIGLVMAALCMKMLIPAGMMIEHDSQTLTVQICADGIVQTLSKQISIPMKSDGGDVSAKGDCAFSALGMSATAGADTALLAMALAFILMLGFAAVRPSLPARVSHLRPPLRGPPAELLTI